jgi:hypothetical protein
LSELDHQSPNMLIRRDARLRLVQLESSGHGGRIDFVRAND